MKKRDIINHTYAISYNLVQYSFPLISQFCVSVNRDLRINVKVKRQWLSELMKSISFIRTKQRERKRYEQ